MMAYLILFLLGGSSLKYVLLRKENAKRRSGKRNVWVEGKIATEINALGDNEVRVAAPFSSANIVHC